MEGEEAVIDVIDALDALGIEYMVVGSLSSNFYGVPRSTEDADFRRALRGNQMQPKPLAFAARRAELRGA